MKRLTLFLAVLLALLLAGCRSVQTKQSSSSVIQMRDSVIVRDSVRMRDSVRIVTHSVDSVRVRDSVVIWRDSYTGAITAMERYHEAERLRESDRQEYRDRDNRRELFHLADVEKISELRDSLETMRGVQGVSDRQQRRALRIRGVSCFLIGFLIGGVLICLSLLLAMVCRHDVFF